MRVNILNVCTPAKAEQEEIAAALSRLPSKPNFARDYEISRGHTTSAEGAAADFVRIHRDLAKESPFLSVQFSYSVSANTNRETTVFHSREAKEVLQISLEDEVASGTSPASVIAADTPVGHIRIERYGKTSLVLARCPNADQSAYEPLFASASRVMAAYRVALDAKRIVPEELSRLLTVGPGYYPPKIKPMGKR
ncbi:MAG: hypothetical protein ACR2IF_18660 [Terriglobales bacterium]